MDILQNNWLVLLKTVKTMRKKKDRLRNYHGKEKPESHDN